MLKIIIALIIFLGENQIISASSKKVIVVSGGIKTKSLSVIKSDGYTCDVQLEDVPQRYGTETGRIGSLMDSGSDDLVVCGGYAGSGPPFSSFKDCVSFDLVNRTWSNDKDMPELNAFAGVASRSTSSCQELYSVGGYHPSNPGPGPTRHLYSDLIAVRNYDTGEWRVLDTKLPRSVSHLCAAIDGNHLYAVGQLNGKLDLTTEKWEDLPTLGVNQIGCEITSYKGKKVLVVVGAENFYLDLDDQKSGWKVFPQLNISRPSRPSLHSIDGKLIVVGGNDETLDLEVFSEENDSWDVIKDGLTLPRTFHSAALVDSVFFPECL